MTYVSARFAQADPGIVSGSTIERKKMSTKTIYKRIALVAVAGLVSGLVSVAPANAAGTVPVWTDADDIQYGYIGQTISDTFGLTLAVGDDTEAEVGSTLSVSAPSGSGVTLADQNGSATGAVAMFSATGFAAGLATAVATPAVSAAGAISFGTAPTAAGAMTVGTATIIPDVAGTYTLTLTPSTGAAVSQTIYVADLYVTTADGLASGLQNRLVANGVAGPNNTVGLGVRVQASGDPRLVKVTGPGKIVSCGTAADCTIASDLLSAVVVDAASGANDGTMVIATPTVGTVTVEVFDENSAGIYSTASYGKVVITVNAAATAGAISTATSTAVMTASGTGAVSADALSLTGASTGNATIGSIDLTLGFVAGQCLATNVTTVAITGPGLLTVSSGATNGTGRSLAEIGDCDFDIAIKGDGSTGKSTVTITSGAFTATRTVTFFGSANKIVATQVLNRASTAGAALGNTSGSTTSAVNLIVTDSTGNPVNNVTPTVVSSNSTVIASGTCSASTATGASYCSVTSAANTAGKTASVTFKTTVSGVDIVSNAVTFTLGGALSKFSWAFGKTSYAPGEKMTITITGVDATGAATFDGAKDIFATAITPSASTTYSSTADLAGVAFVGGKGTITLFAPLSAGPFSITAGIEAGFQVAMGAISSTVTTNVVAPANAEIATLTTLVNSLIAKINALNKLVVKIQKKVN